MRNFNKNYLPYVLGVLICLGLMVQVCLHIATLREKNTLQCEYSIEQEVNIVSRNVAAEIGYAESRIQIIAADVMSNMQSDTLNDYNRLLDKYLISSPFSLIEYIRQDGINVLYNGEQFDASQRVYFVEGIKGNTGVWCNFQPKLSDEVLLNFYTPLRRDGRIVGVLTGAMGGDSKLRKHLNASILGEKSFGILCDRDSNIIATNFTHNKNTHLKVVLEKLGINEEQYNIIRDKKNLDNGLSFYVNDGKGEALAAVTKVRGANCYVLQIIPSLVLAFKT